MDWIFDNIQIVGVALVVIFSLLKQIHEAKQEERKKQEAPEDDGDAWIPPPRLPRKQPAPSIPVPPKLDSPRRVPQVRGVTTPDAPPMSASMTEAASALQRQQEMMDRLQRAKEAKAQRVKTVETHGGKRAHSATPAGTASARTSLRATLGKRSEIRRAVVLREILGPPVGLR